MILAAVFAVSGVLLGANITYHGAVPLAKQYPAAWLIFLSFNVLAVGMLLVVADFILTIFAAVERKMSLESWATFFRDIPIAAFAAITGLFIAGPGLIAALKVFIPAFLSSIGTSSLDPGSYRMSWHMAFHIYHYVPALALVGVAYVLVEAVADAQSVYPKQVAKALFLLYPFFVPPTFIYHLLVDPNIPERVKFVGSALGLLVGTPTILHMFIITGMLEARMRQAGYGFLGWLGHLPWRNPAFGSLAMGMVTLFVGGLLSYALIQQQLSPIFHNTFVVPAYIHPMAAGGANLIYMGSLFYGMAVLTEKQLWGLNLARILPYWMGGAILWMSAFGTAAGLAGVPRRYALLGAEAPASWVR
jgi:cytochrome c oxidase subunit 1